MPEGTPAVVVLHDSPEAGQEALDVAAALSERGFRCEFSAVDRGRLFEIVADLSARRSHTLAVNLVRHLAGDEAHGPLLPGLLALHDVRYTGMTASSLSSAVDRRVTKAILYAAGIPTPGGRVFRAVPQPDAVRDMAFPLVVKAVRKRAAGATSPLTFAADPEELCAKVQAVLDATCSAALAEVYLEGREFQVTVAGEGRGARALPPAEVELDTPAAETPRFAVRNRTSRTRCPADAGEHVKVSLATAAVAAYRSLEGRGCATVRLRLDASAKPQVLGVTPVPDLARGHDLARAVEASGDLYEDFVVRLIEGAWTRP